MATAGDPLTLPLWAKGWRVVVLLVVAAAFLAGTTLGDDHWWPFAPWRMFSTSTPPSGFVASMVLEVRSADQPSRWRPASLAPESVGLNRAEVEGRVAQMQADPSMLGALARSHAGLHPAAPRWVAVRVVRTEAVLVDRVPSGEVRRKLVAQWEAP